jgi:hypothetical protein
MFLGNNKENNYNTEEGSGNKDFFSLLNTKNALIIMGILFFIVIIVFLFIFVISGGKKDDSNSLEKEAPEDQSQYSLPGELPGGDGNGLEREGSELRAENLLFSKYYNKDETVIEANIKDYDLPINIKQDVANYYEIYRKVNLDNAIDDLNKNGFAIIKNPFGKEAEDFFGMYSNLDSRNIPILITSDFLYYYQQNVYKDVYEKIQKDIFYENFWEISKSFFTIADTRYRSKYNKTGPVNSPVMEAQRLEALFFGVLLKILEPEEKQISKKDGLDIEGEKFSEVETEKYKVDFPAYLKNDIEKELKFIKEAREKQKSPTLFYELDYRKFEVPEEYKKSAKLNNFYQASRWANSLFPLYNKNSECEECLLDEDDWLINFITSAWIAKDFSDNQELKNKWAKIYKFIYFFKGLREDLTYLHYDESLRKIFGDDYDLDVIFNRENDNFHKNIFDLRDDIIEYDFLDLSGERNYEKREDIGMRVLQEELIPDDLIFKKLTIPYVSDYLVGGVKRLSNNNITGCRYGTNFQRCRALGLDVINLIAPVSLERNNYFKENTNFKNYFEESEKLEKIINDFSVNNWHDNNYWSVLYSSKYLFDVREKEKYSYMNSLEWEDRMIETSLGTWLNLRLPKDELVPNSDNRGFGLGEYNENMIDYNYVELNRDFVLELEANTNMLFDMLDELKILDEAGGIHVVLKDLQQDIEIIKRLTEKRIKGEDLNFNDWQAIVDFAVRFKIEESGVKTVNINFKNNSNAGSLRASMSGVDLLVLIYQYGDKKVIAMGPIFNYQER